MQNQCRIHRKTSKFCPDSNDILNCGKIFNCTGNNKKSSCQVQNVSQNSNHPPYGTLQNPCRMCVIAEPLNSTLCKNWLFVNFLSRFPRVQNEMVLRHILHPFYIRQNYWVPAVWLSFLCQILSGASANALQALHAPVAVLAVPCNKPWVCWWVLNPRLFCFELDAYVKL